MPILDVCEFAWRDRTGYAFLSTRNPQLSKEDPGYWVDHAFRWPDDRAKLHSFVRQARRESLDLYWAPVLFSEPRRSASTAQPTDLLYADLDEVDPNKLPRNLKPTAAWETSPGRFAAVWRLDEELDPSVQTQLNQRLTYTIGADKGGWGLSKVLRIPGTVNHKYPDNPRGRQLWLNGHQLRSSQVLADLPELGVGHELHESEDGRGDLPDPQGVMRSYHIPSRARAILRSKHADVGTRSDRLWQLECILAEAGLAAPEIAALVRPSVWNKYRGRRDEITRLLTEARKAIAHAGLVVEPTTNGHVLPEAVEEDEVSPLVWSAFDRDRKPPRWLVGEIWGEAEVGFISGLPKSYKSWIALDLAVSVAVGGLFLNKFQAAKHNVLLIQEEDPRPVLQMHLSQVAASKGLIEAEMMGGTVARLRYSLPDNLFIISNAGFVVNDEWLPQLEQWVMDRDIGLLIMDPLSMIAGEVDEFKLFELMSGLLKPLKQLREATQTAICIVHHHSKDSTKTGAAGMYGSVAFWAWEESALHLAVEGISRVKIERFSKHEMLNPITVELGDPNEVWNPQMTENRPGALEDHLQSGGGFTVDELSAVANLGRDAVVRHLRSYELQGKVIKKVGMGTGKSGRKADLWEWVRVHNPEVEGE